MIKYQKTTRKIHFSKREKTMSDNINTNKRKSLNWIIAIVVNVLILILVLKFNHLYYETNDDFGISRRLYDGFPYIGFVNYFLCKTIIFIQNIFPNINIFILSQLTLSFLSFIAIYKLIIDRSRRFSTGIIAAAIIAIFSLDHYSSVQFTKTAALLMCVGLVIVIDNHLHERFIRYYLLGYLLLYIGAAYRQKVMLPTMAFAGAFVFVNLITEYKEHKNKITDKKSFRKEVIYLLIVAMLAMLPYGIDKLSDSINSSTDLLKTARSYHKERAKVTDYPTYQFYEENKAKYEEAGFSENDIYLVSHFLLDYDGAASYENLKKINEINYPSVVEHRSIQEAGTKFVTRTGRSILSLKIEGVHIIILLILSLILLIVSEPKKWLYVLMFGGLAVAMHISLYYIQRPQYRAFYTVDISVALWLLYVLSLESGKMAKKKRLIAVTLLSGVAIGYLFVPLAENTEIGYFQNVRKIQTETVSEFYNNNSDKFYICSTNAKKRHSSYLNPLEIPVKEKNATGQGGWGTLYPYELDQLAEFGMKNLVGDAIDNDNVYFVGTSKLNRLREYYNKWYGDDRSEIVFVEVDKIENQKIFQIIKVPQQD